MIDGRRRITLFRLANGGMTLTSFAHLCGISKSWVSSYMMGRRRMTEEMARRIAPKLKNKRVTYKTLMED